MKFEKLKMSGASDFVYFLRSTLCPKLFLTSSENKHTRRKLSFCARLFLPWPSAENQYLWLKKWFEINGFPEILKHSTELDCWPENVLFSRFVQWSYTVLNGPQWQTMRSSTRWQVGLRYILDFVRTGYWFGWWLLWNQCHEPIIFSRFSQCVLINNTILNTLQRKSWGVPPEQNFAELPEHRHSFCSQLAFDTSGPCHENPIFSEFTVFCGLLLSLTVQP